MADKGVIAGTIASVIAGGGGLAAWTDLNVGVAENKQAIQQEQRESQIHRDYLKEELLEIKQLIKELKKE